LTERGVPHYKGRALSFKEQGHNRQSIEGNVEFPEGRRIPIKFRLHSWPPISEFLKSRADNTFFLIDTYQPKDCLTTSSVSVTGYLSGCFVRVFRPRRLKLNKKIFIWAASADTLNYP
jgi:hypothetical protein